MALIDTEGRTLKEDRGKSREANVRKDGLRFSEFGLAPKAAHDGCLADHPTGRRYLDQARSETEVPRGKRAIHMEHKLYGEERKRQAGKIGLKKVTPSFHNNDKPRGKSGSEFRGMTSAQRAVAQIKAITHQDPNALGIPMDGPELFETEKQLEREARVQEATQYRDNVLNRPNSHSNRKLELSGPSLKTPFAVAGDTEAVPYHATRRHCAPPASAAPEKKPAGRSVDPARYRSRDVPFDTVDSGVYPDPPPIGEHIRHAAKGAVKRQAECPEDRDTMARKRAQARAHYGVRQNPDIIFGNPPPEKPKAGVAHVAGRRDVGPALLDHSRAESGNSDARTGTKMFGHRHKSTALW